MPKGVADRRSIGRIGLLGASGRVGRQIAALVTPVLSVSRSTGQLEALIAPHACDAIIDFSSPEATRALAHLFLSAPKDHTLPAWVIGTTGLTEDDHALLAQVARRAPVLYAANFSAGVPLLMEILSTYATRLERLGFKPHLTETHHVHKKDAPSGTAHALAKAMLPVETPIQSVREGEVLGEHVIRWEGPHGHEALTLSHSALDRRLFAQGALDAAYWILNQPRAELPPRVLNRTDTLT